MPSPCLPCRRFIFRNHIVSCRVHICLSRVIPLHVKTSTRPFRVKPCREHACHLMPCQTVCRHTKVGSISNRAMWRNNSVSSFGQCLGKLTISGTKGYGTNNILVTNYLKNFSTSKDFLSRHNDKRIRLYI